MTIQLQPATAADAERLLPMLRAFYAESGYPLDEGIARRALGALLADPALGRVWIAARDGADAGYLVLTFGFSIEHHGRDALVDELYVRQDARRSGVARALLDAAERACAECGVHALHLEVEDANPGAEALYRGRGFAGNARKLLTKRIAPCVAALLLLFASQQAAAWGPNGHRITGEIAWQNLDSQTRAALLPLLPEGRYDTLAEAAAWADTFARTPPRTYRWLDPYHYVNVDPDAEQVRAGRDCGCVVGAIENQAARLRDPHAPRDAKVEALRLVAHFVGDVHQPLHVSHPDMRGGTTIDVRFDGRPMTLHKLWDSGLLERRLRERRGRGSRWRGHAQSLAAGVTPAQRAAWTASLDPRDWAGESLRAARAHTFAIGEGAPLGDAYYAASMPVVDQRLVQSGVRLAALLDAIFAPGSRAAPGMD